MHIPNQLNRTSILDTLLIWTISFWNSRPCKLCVIAKLGSCPRYLVNSLQHYWCILITITSAIKMLQNKTNDRPVKIGLLFHNIKNQSSKRKKNYTKCLTLLFIFDKTARFVSLHYRSKQKIKNIHFLITINSQYRQKKRVVWNFMGRDAFYSFESFLPKPFGHLRWLDPSCLVLKQFVSAENGAIWERN